MDNNKDKSIIGNLCKEYREKTLGITQERFGIEHHVPYAAVVRFEQGRSKSMWILFEYMKAGFKPPLTDDILYEDVYGNSVNGSNLSIRCEKERFL